MKTSANNILLILDVDHMIWSISYGLIQFENISYCRFTFLNAFQIWFKILTSNNPSVGNYEEKEYKVLIVENSFEVILYIRVFQ